jgi:capsid protein
MKIEQLIGLVFTREKLGEGGPLDDVQEDEEDEEDTDETDDDGNRYTKLDWGGGPVQVDLDPGDDLKFVTSQNPSAQFQQFMQMSIQVCLKALDIPYSFYAENFSNYSGSRQAMLQYNLASSIKRQDGQELLDELTLWRALLWIQDGQLEGVAPDDLAWQWVPTGLPWIDPLKEIQAQLAALGAKLTSRQRILRESGGGDFDDVVAELDYENKKLEAHNMSAEVVPGMIQDDEEQPQPMHGEQT